MYFTLSLGLDKMWPTKMDKVINNYSEGNTLRHVDEFHFSKFKLTLFCNLFR
jgi:hypothetical protein